MNKMENEKDLQRLYDLIELYDFEELQEREKSFIRRHISEDEYKSMRSTLKDTKELFVRLHLLGWCLRLLIM